MTDGPRALLVQPDPFELPGLVGRSLADRGFVLDAHVIQEDFERPVGNADFPPIGGHELVVVLGSPWSVYDPVVSGWVDPLTTRLRAVVEAEVPVLGICFGAQALSVALGGEVTPAADPEFGWTEVEGRGALGGRWFEYHQDVFTVPDGAVEMATTAAGSQAFVVGRSLAVQFHPELDAAQLELWYGSGEEGRLQHAGIDTQAVMEETVHMGRSMPARVDALVDWFLDDVARLDRTTGDRLRPRR